MKEKPNTPLLEIIQDVEQLFINHKWQAALDMWVNNTDTLKLIKWLAKNISPSVSSEFTVLLHDIIKWKDGDDEQRWEIFKKSESMGFVTQAGALGLSLFISGGSMSPSSYEPVYAPLYSVKKIVHGILINQSVITSDIPSEGARELFRQWCSYHQ